MKRISVVIASATLMAASFLLGAFFGPGLLELKTHVPPCPEKDANYLPPESKLLVDMMKRAKEMAQADAFYLENQSKALAKLCRVLTGAQASYCNQLSGFTQKAASDKRLTSDQINMLWTSLFPAGPK